MNAQVKAIWNRAASSHVQAETSFQTQQNFLARFAELIVKECIYRVRSRQQFAGEDQQNVTQAFDLLVYDLESHFGVEE